MYVPIIKKIIYKDEVLIERALPGEGHITVSVGDRVEPSDKLGTCKIVYEVVELGEKFKPNQREDGSNYYANEALVGTRGRDKFHAPFGGLLERNAQGFIFKSEERDYWLLPGVWGTVKDIAENRSVLLSTQTVDVHIPVTCGEVYSGELIVFPNPSEMLTVQYFNNYIKSAKGKVVYVGNNVSIDLIRTAHNLKIKSILAGSASKEAFDYAREKGLSLGLFVGFGNIKTPEPIYNFINEVTNRYVFFYTHNKTLQVPVPTDSGFEKNKRPKKILKHLKKGLTVQVLNSENFGQMGVVDRVSKSGIFVKLHENNEVIQVKLPNLLIIE